MLSSHTRWTRFSITLTLAAGATLLAGCAGPAADHVSAHGSQSHTASPTPHPNTASSANAKDDLDDDDDDDDEGDDDGDFDDDDEDDDGDFDDDDLEAAGLNKKHVDDIDNDDDLKDYLNDAQRASDPAYRAYLCVPVHPDVDDIIEANLSGTIEEVAGASADDGVGYYLSVELQSGQIALLYATATPVASGFAGEIYSANDVASSVTTFAWAGSSAIDVGIDTGATRAPLCL